MSLYVSRYCRPDPLNGTPSGDFLRVGEVDLGPFQDIVTAEYERAKREHPGESPAFHMRPMFHTGSTYGAEILKLADEVRK